jgi:hypothetical protein
MKTITKSARLSIKTKTNTLLGAVLFLLALPVATNAAVYDLTADFSTVQNPNCVWSYGWTESRGSTFNLVTDAQEISASYGTVRGWIPYGGFYPGLLSPGTAVTDWDPPGEFIPAGTVSFHPGPLNQNSVIRWTAPSAGTSTIQGWFRGNNYHGPTTTDVAILHGATEIFTGEINSYNVPLNFSLTVQVNAGDTIDFTVGFGSNGNYFGDATGISATITHDGIGNTCGNQSPLATDDFYGINQASSLSVPSPGVLANDSDPDEDGLTVELVAAPANADSFQLNPDGSFSYTPPPYFYGEDSFTYRANDGTVSSEVATVHITVSQPGSQGFITGGGKFFQDGRKCTFGFVAKVQGNLEFQDHDMSFDVKADTMDWVYAPNQIDGSFSGTCKVNGETGYTFFVQIHDQGQPGSNDDFTIWIFDSFNNPVYSAGALLSGGNIVIHGH